jgi:hypothetical protein
MSFIKKIKQFLGIGTVSVKLAVPSSFKVSDSIISGTVNITGKSDQKIKSIVVELEETYTKGKGDDKDVTTFKLGKVKLDQPFDIKEGEVISKSFDLPFALLKSTNDKLKEQGGVMGGLGKVGAFLDAEKSEYTVIATVDVDGAKLDPNDIAKIKKVA